MKSVSAWVRPITVQGCKDCVEVYDIALNVNIFVFKRIYSFFQTVPFVAKERVFIEYAVC